MFAVYKRELQSFFTSMIGYLVVAAMLLFVGIYFVFLNVRGGNASFAYSLYSMNFIFIVAIPILTMRSIAEDKRSKTDQLLLTSPASVASIIIGKYLAMCSVIAIVCIVNCIYPLLLKTMGSNAALVDYSMNLAFFLFGCAAIAIGLFISALTESQILACIGTFGILLILQLMTSMTDLIPTSAAGSYFGLILILLIACCIAYNTTKNWIISGGAAAFGCIVLTIIYFVKSSVYESLLPNFLNQLSLSERLYSFYNKVFDIPALVYFVSIICVFLFFTIQTIEKRRWS